MKPDYLNKFISKISGRWLLFCGLMLTAAIYWPGLSGGFLFDDYPNIVDNPNQHLRNVSIASLVSAALSSPASDFKRPLASLSFAANYLITGLDPYWMKLTNLVIHLLNGFLFFLLAKALLKTLEENLDPPGIHSPKPHTSTRLAYRSVDLQAALIAVGWMLLPINLTAVLYVIQRMESMANLFVVVGLIGYVHGRRQMMGYAPFNRPNSATGTRGLLISTVSITLPTAIGALVKETAVMLPLYALLVECMLFGFKKAGTARNATFLTVQSNSGASNNTQKDPKIATLFVLTLALPMAAGLIWLLPDLLDPATWANRNFTLHTRLLSEARIIVDYIIWTLLPSPFNLSFYHDDFVVSTGLFEPWTTAACIMILLALVVLGWSTRKSRPIVALGIGLFLACHLLTGTIVPLELIYEHRNYFASFGLLLAAIPILAPLPSYAVEDATPAAQPFSLPRYVLLAGMMILWATQTAFTANAWSTPLRLAQELAIRAPDSPRAQYELGRMYIIASGYDPASPYTKLAYSPLEKAAALPDSSILPEQALIFMNARMHLPIKNSWWESMIAKLKEHKPGVQDESSLATLTQCARDHECDLPKGTMMKAFLAALSHPHPSARLLAIYGDYAWNVLNDHALGTRMTEAAVQAQPREPAYHITLTRMLIDQGNRTEAEEQLKELEVLDIGGSLKKDIFQLRELLHTTST